MNEFMNKFISQATLGPVNFLAFQRANINVIGIANKIFS